MADEGWQRKFDDPVTLHDGRMLITLRHAADYITALPKEESDLAKWQVATRPSFWCRAEVPRC